MRRMRRHSFRRRSRPPMQWVASPAGFGTGQGQTAGAAPVGIELCGASGAAAEFDPIIIQRFTVLSVRGDIRGYQNLSGTAGAVVSMNLGIIVTKFETVGGTLLYDPGKQVDAGAPWLWINHYQVAESSSGPNLNFAWDENLPFGAHVSTRTKRVLRQNERLYLMFSVSTLNGTSSGSYSITPYLRTLVSRVA